MSASIRKHIANASQRRVAAYARVSTDSEAQLTSYEAQVDYYTKYIHSKPEWVFVGVYADEGVSATSITHREGFKRMVSDALNGKIDLIITKSISRFARNTVDTLTTVRQLREKGIEVYFEKENISTLDNRGELLISLLSSIAQTESFQLSKNITWGKRKRCADGIVNLPYKRFLGYEKGPDGNPKIVEKEAKTIHLIYQLFLKGKTPVAIAKHLTRNGIPTPGHKTNWRHQTVQSILTNEKYKGDALLQKTVTVDFLSKAKKRNEGEAPQYYVENSHAPIISKDLFNIVQYELKRRKDSGMRTRSDERFSGKIICGTCGSACWRSRWLTKENGREFVWICSKRAQKASACHSPFVPEEVVEQAFLYAMGDLYQNKTDIISEYGSLLEPLCDTTTMDIDITRLKNEMDICRRKLQHCQERGRGQYPTVKTQYETLQKQLSNVYEKRNERLAKSYRIRLFLDQLISVNQPMTEFDTIIWDTLVDSMIVRSEDSVSIVYKSGHRMDVNYSSTNVQQMRAYRSDTAYGTNAADSGDTKESAIF